MKRRLEMPDGIHLKKYQDGTRGIVIRVDACVLNSLLVEVCLLCEFLVERLVCIGEHGTTISLAIASNSTPRACVFGASAEAIEIELLPRDLDLIRSFLLKYYRDGIAEVSHIDIGLYERNTNCEEGMLTIQAADVRPALSGDEARRILGIA